MPPHTLKLQSRRPIHPDEFFDHTRFASDSSSGITGWSVDSVALYESTFICRGSLTPPVIFNLHSVPPGGIAFSYDTLAWQTYFLETTTNPAFANWSALNTNSGGGLRISWTNSAVDSAQRYFRLRTQ